MKAENILNSSLLDIIFQNKNKDYGAYELRKHYSNRLFKSIGITALIVIVFAGLQSWKSPKNSNDFITKQLDGAKLIEYKPPILQPKEVEKTKPAIKKEVAEVLFTKPVIVPKKEIINVVAENARIDTSTIGNQFKIGEGNTNLVGVISAPPQESGNAKTGDDDSKKENDDEPIANPSVMPEFIGGIAALHNFMLRNLQTPEDIDEGQKIVVMAKFVIDKKGNISDVEIIQNGREDLDAEVIRVINKMPTWKPGLQNGFPVAVYFKMPITFVNNN